MAWPISAAGKAAARVIGVNENLFDLRRCAMVHNPHVIARTGTLDHQDAA